MSSNYWNHEDNELIRLFWYCSSAVTSASTRNKIFNILQPKLNYLINNAVNSNVSSWSNEDKEEVRSDLMLKIWQVLSNKLDENRIKAVLNFLWIVTNNRLISITRTHNKVKKPKIEFNGFSDDYIDDEEYDEIKEVDLMKVRQEIYNELDKKIIEQEKVRTNAFYLLKLKEYLEQNNCDGSGFQEFICNELQINKENFYQINYMLGLKSGVFKSKKFK